MKIVRSVRKGFTLIETLVTVIVVGVLAAVIIPAVTQQAVAGDPMRIVEDFGNVAGGIERFTVEMRPRFPGDIDDLVNKPLASSSTGDVALDGGVYTSGDIGNWNGPYVVKPSADILVVSSTSNWMPTGFSASIIQKIYKCNSTPQNSCNATSPDYVAIAASPLTAGQFELVNKVVDGVETAGSGESYAKGKLRYDPVASTTYYLVAPCGVGC